MKRFLMLITLVSMTFALGAQQAKSAKQTAAPAKSYQTVTIQTNGTSDQCKRIIMDNASQWMGVKECSYDAKTSKLTVTYDSSKTSPDRLRAQVSKLGYNADNVKADAAAREKLPSCCKSASSSGCGSHQGCGSHPGGCGGCGKK